MTTPFVYVDPDGDHLRIAPASGASIKLSAHDTSDDERTEILVRTADLDRVVAEMYKAAGVPAPVVLSSDEVADDWVRVTPTGGAA